MCNHSNILLCKLTEALINDADTMMGAASVRMRIKAEQICHDEPYKYYDGEINLSTEKLIVEISQLLTDLITEEAGEPSSNQISKVNLQLSKILTELLSISVTQGEISFDSRKRIAGEFTILLRELLLN